MPWVHLTATKNQKTLFSQKNQNPKRRSYEHSDFIHSAGLALPMLSQGLQPEHVDVCVLRSIRIEQFWPDRDGMFGLRIGSNADDGMWEGWVSVLLFGHRELGRARLRSFSTNDAKPK